MRHFMLAATTALCLACTPAPSVEPGGATKTDASVAAEEQPTARHFVGALTVGDKTIDWLIRYEPSASAESVARLWIPEQHVHGLATATVADAGALTLGWVALKLEWSIAADGTSCEFSQAGHTVPCDLEEIDAAEFADYIELDRPQTPQPPFPYASVDLLVPNPDADGVSLAGTLTIPEGPGPHPAVVLVSGSGAQDRDETLFGHQPFLLIADALTRRGIAVMRYDDRGWARSTGEPAGTTADFAGDALAVMRAIGGRPEIDAGRVGIIGHSEGGLIAPYLAARYPGEVAFIVMLAGPGVVGHELLALQSELNMRLSETDEAKIVEDAALFAEVYELVATAAEDEVGEAIRERWRAVKGEDGDAELTALLGLAVDPWMRFFLAYDPGGDLAKVECPVLALIGTTDIQVDDEQNLPAIEEALSRGGNDDVTVEARAGLNHLFQRSASGDPEEYGVIAETFDPVTLVLIGDWLVERVL